MLYEVAVLQKPTPKEAKDGKVESLVFGPESVVAVDNQAACLKIMKDGAAEKLREFDADRLVWLVRPFA